MEHLLYFFKKGGLLVKRDSCPFVVFSLAVFFLLTFSSFVLAAEPINATKEPVVVYNPYYIGIFGGFVVPDELKVDNGGQLSSITAGLPAPKPVISSRSDGWQPSWSMLIWTTRMLMSLERGTLKQTT